MRRKYGIFRKGGTMPIFYSDSFEEIKAKLSMFKKNGNLKNVYLVEWNRNIGMYDEIDFPKGI